MVSDETNLFVVADVVVCSETFVVKTDVMMELLREADVVHGTVVVVVVSICLVTNELVVEPIWNDNEPTDEPMLNNKTPVEVVDDLVLGVKLVVDEINSDDEPEMDELIEVVVVFIDDDDAVFVVDDDDDDDDDDDNDSMDDDDDDGSIDDDDDGSLDDDDDGSLDDDDDLIDDDNDNSIDDVVDEVGVILVDETLLYCDKNEDEDELKDVDKVDDGTTGTDEICLGDNDDV